MDGNFPSILVTGSRQSGKSTVLQYLATKKKQVLHEVSLDDLTERTHALEDPESFLRTHGVPLIIDEFQYAQIYFLILRLRLMRHEKMRCLEMEQKSELYTI